MADHRENQQRTEGSGSRCHWVVPADRYGKTGLGLGREGGSAKDDDTQSYAKLADTEIAARISCELRDHPLFLVPLKQRAKLLTELNLPQSFILSEYIQKCDLSQKLKKIFEEILPAFKGDSLNVTRPGHEAVYSIYN